ncbi:MAG TPA: GAF domain-containing sensor histidine kinase [Puia sp.]
MDNPALPYDEGKRLAALKEYRILDSSPEEAFDGITRLAAAICQTAAAAILLIDSQSLWFKSVLGLEIRETPLNNTLVAEARNPGIFIVPDARKEERFAGKPLIAGDPELVFYAGVPLVDPEGWLLGLLCVMDRKPGELSEMQQESLQMLAGQVLQLLKWRKAALDIEKLKEDLDETKYELEQFTYVISHDIKSPLSSIVLSAEMLRENFGDAIDENNDQLLNVLSRASFKIRNLVEAVHSFYRGKRVLNEPAEPFELRSSIESVVLLLKAGRSAQINYPAEDVFMHGNRVALEQILINLLQNAIRYSDKEITVVDIRFRETESFYYFEVQDNGRGIALADQQKIFEPFTSLGIPDRAGIRGTGLGLTTVKNLVEKQGGEIGLHSTPGEGTQFEFSIRKNVR